MYYFRQICWAFFPTVKRTEICHLFLVSSSDQKKNLPFFPAALNVTIMNNDLN
jgi:hypothetical protein